MNLIKFFQELDYLFLIKAHSPIRLYGSYLLKGKSNKVTVPIVYLNL